MASIAKQKAETRKEAANDWRGKLLQDIRRIVLESDPQAVEERKWMGTPTWSHNGILCLAETFKDMVKIMFYQGAKLHDPHKLFNAELEGNQRRAIKLFEGDKLNEAALKNLVREALAFNLSKPAKKPAKSAAPKAAKKK